MSNKGEWRMSKLFLVAVFVLAATSPTLSQGGFNPGTVVNNVYENLAPYGCGPGFGFSPSGCNYFGPAPDDRCYHRYERSGPSITRNCYAPPGRDDLATPRR